MSQTENSDTSAKKPTKKAPTNTKQPLATPDLEHRGHGWVQKGVTNVAIDPDAILDDSESVEDDRREASRRD